MTFPLFNHANARVAGPYLQPLLEVVGNKALDAEALCRSAGLAGKLLSPLPETISARQYLQLLDAGAMLCDDPCFGLHVGEKVKMGTYNVYGLILLSCHNLGQVLQQTIRYEGLAHDLGQSGLEVENGIARYTWACHFPDASRHLVESVFGGIRVFGHWLLGMPLPAMRIMFCHSQPAPDLLDEYVRVLGRLPEFGAPRNCAEFDAALLDYPVPNADVSLYPVLQQHAEQLLRSKARANSPAATLAPALASNDIVMRVSQAIGANLAKDQVRLPLIAAELHLSPRTLQRKLAEAGSNFQQVLDQTRYRLACEYLQQPALSLIDIAFLLGFAEQSSFNHAFKEWSGQNPGALREKA